MFVKGDAVEVNATVDGQTSKIFDFVKSCDITLNIDIETVGHLGFSSDFSDETFSGADVSLEIDQKTTDYVDFIAIAVRRTKSRQSGEQFNCSAKVEFPDGQKRRLLFPDFKLRNPNISASDRKSRVTGKLEIHSDTVKFP